jgi:hypothetical protein
VSSIVRSRYYEVLAVVSLGDCLGGKRLIQGTEHVGYLVLDFDSLEEDMVEQSHLKEESTLDLELSLCDGRETGSCLIGSQSLAVSERRCAVQAQRRFMTHLHDSRAWLKWVNTYIEGKVLLSCGCSSCGNSEWFQAR